VTDQVDVACPTDVSVSPHVEPVPAAEPSPAGENLPYRIEKVLHSSHTGGLYAAEDTRDGTRVVLKEAGPSETAVARLRHEHAMLERLAGIEGVPAVHDHFVVDDHHFLALRQLHGRPLSKVLAERYPWCASPPDAHDFADYTRWALGVHHRISRVVAAIHERGVVHTDLHLINILIRRDGGVAVIDFGSACDVEEHPRATLTRHGYVAPSDRTGFALDRYTLACLGLALFLPMTAVTRFDTGRARQVTRAIARQFPVPAHFLIDSVRVIEGTGDGSAPAWSPQRSAVAITAHQEAWKQAKGALTAAILASATPERDDCLFPGHFDQLTAGGLGIAHGAAGVLYALAATDSGRYPSFEEWLAERALRPEATARPGLYDGLHGVAYVLDHLGHRQRALDVLDRCRRSPRPALGVDLFGGLSGIGLNLARFAESCGDRELLTDALAVADEISDGAEPTGQQGLMYGWSGPALLFVRLYRHTGDAALLDLARTALRWELCRFPRAQDGLARGGCGIALVLDEYLACQDDTELAQESHNIRQSVCVPGHNTPGLFDGNAGILAYLGHHCPPGEAVGDPAIGARTHQLTWHALAYQRCMADGPGQRGGRNPAGIGHRGPSGAGEPAVARPGHGLVHNGFGVGGTQCAHRLGEGAGRLGTQRRQHPLPQDFRANIASLRGDAASVVGQGRIRHPPVGLARFAPDQSRRGQPVRDLGEAAAAQRGLSGELGHRHPVAGRAHQTQENVERRRCQTEPLADLGHHAILCHVIAFDH
jgi:hypothetical protein